MKKIFYFIILLVGVVIANTACDDWTEVECYSYLYGWN